MMVGALNAIITAIVVYVMMEIVDLEYTVANVIAYITAQTNNFFWSKYWVFASYKGKFQREMPLFLLAFGTAFCTQFVSLVIMVEWLGLNEYLAQFFGLFIYGTINFIMNRKITFRNL